ncbi:hypothetical protein NPX13_g4421 [Xylaria arbuscula]|uniref:Uncharacterized protein n=1 Tax=Xylaria arbuscula TaxID=114810 RepID=A0A9W8TNN5_9PEZI|nr:hypothetical protein NPX13_g4421 [Xylaria arbuscula]
MHVAYGPSDSSKQTVIVLKTFPPSCVHRLPEDAPCRPDWFRLVPCRNMEERWAVLKDFGATEYDDVKMCPDIPDSLEAGITEGKRYEELLKKTQDFKYLDK